MVKRKSNVVRTRGAATKTPSSSPDAAPSSSLLPPPPQAKTTQKQVIADLQRDNAALNTKMEAMDTKISVLVSQLSGWNQRPQDQDTAVETSPEPLLPMDQASTSAQGQDPVLSGGDEESKRRRMEQQMVDVGGSCSEEPEVTTSPAVISLAIKGLIGFQDQAVFSSR